MNHKNLKSGKRFKMNAGWILIIIGSICLVGSAILIPIGINKISKPKPMLQGTIGTFEIDENKAFTVNFGSNILIIIKVSKVVWI